MKKIIVLLLLIIGASNISIALDKSKIYKDLQAKYGNISSILVEFHSEKFPDIKGILKASKGNKFMLELQGRQIISDGKTVWNYSEEEKNVFIQDFEEFGEDFWVENFFFEFLNSYKPGKMWKESSTNNEQIYVLDVIPDGELVHNLEHVRLYLDKTGKKIKAVSFDFGYKKEKWWIDNLKANPSFSANTFKYKTKEGIEVIDFR